MTLIKFVSCALRRLTAYNVGLLKETIDTLLVSMHDGTINCYTHYIYYNYCSIKHSYLFGRTLFYRDEPSTLSSNELTH